MVTESQKKTDHQLIVDEEAAEHLRKVYFTMYMDGRQL